MIARNYSPYADHPKLSTAANTQRETRVENTTFGSFRLQYLD